MARLFERRYSIKRYWCHSDGTVHVTPDGFLSDSASEHKKGRCEDFDDFEAVLCLILLGEMGIGKSEWLEQHKTSLRARIEARGDEFLYCDLETIHSRADLDNEVFTASVFEPWKNGSHCIHVFLDSFDQTPITIASLKKVVKGKLEKLPLERLFLRILCRTADWSLDFEQTLNDLWKQRLEKVSKMMTVDTGSRRIGESALSGLVQRYEMAPLTERDVEQISVEELGKSAQFLQAVKDHDAGSFAARPLTLGFLIGAYRERRSLPESPFELFREGCERLCREHDGDRSSTSDPVQVMKTAERIAALSVFSNRYTVLGPRSTDRPSPSELQYRDITAHEPVIEETSVDQALQTGLFSARGDNRMGWGHGSFPQFLAAKYIIERKVPPKQVMSLLINPSDPEARIVPGLRATAVWIASKRTDIFDSILMKDPDVLIEAPDEPGSETEVNQRKEKLAEALLKALDAEIILDDKIWMRKALDKLSHPNLSAQLKPYIIDKGKGLTVRRASITIAESCSLSDLQDDLVQVALDTDDDYLVRQEAARGVLAFGSDDAKAQLKPLAVKDSGDDPDDELKRIALMAVWPHHISAEELFTALTPPKNQSFLGAYTYEFLHNHVVAHLEPADLPHALQWVATRQQPIDRTHALHDLAAAIVECSYDHLDDPQVLESFVNVWIAKARRDSTWLPEGSSMPGGESLRLDSTRRRAIVEAVVATCESNPDHCSLRMVTWSLVATREDMDWLIDRISAAETEIARRAYALLIKTHFHPSDTALTEKLFPFVEKIEELHAEIGSFFGSIGLDSEKAERLRNTFYEGERRREAQQSKQIPEPPAFSDIEPFLEPSEDCQHEAFAQMVVHIKRRIPSDDLSDFFEKSFSDWGALRRLDTEQLQRIARAAVSFLTHFTPSFQRYLEHGTLSGTDTEGFEALTFLFLHRKDVFDTLPDDVLRRWAPVVLEMQWAYEDRSWYSELLATIYRKAPKEILSAIQQIIEKENRDREYPHVIDVLHHCWDYRLRSALLEKVKDEALKPVHFRGILKVLLKQCEPEARDIAESYLTGRIPSNGIKRQKALLAASILMVMMHDSGWPVIWPVMKRCPAFGRELLNEFASDRDLDSSRFFKGLSEEQLAELYSWVCKEMPESATGSAGRTLRPATEWYRQSVVTELTMRGTWSAVEALEHIIEKHEDHAEDLKYSLAAARANAREITWTPWSPKEITDLLQDEERRLVGSAGQLQDVVMEALRRYQETLRTRSAQLEALWNVETISGEEKGKSKKAKKKRNGSARVG
jgi:hypothetical protein